MTESRHLLQRLGIGQIAGSYGGRLSLLRYLLARALHRIGYYRKFDRVDWAQVQRLVFVCTGNICRSPFAAILAEDLGIESVSFGLKTRGGDSADPGAMMAASRLGIDLSGHISMRGEDFVPVAGDLLIGMEPRHVHRLAEDYAAKDIQITLLGLSSRPFQPLIPDPYGRGPQYFDACFSWIRGHTEAAVARIKAVNE